MSIPFFSNRNMKAIILSGGTSAVSGAFAYEGIKLALASIVGGAGCLTSVFLCVCGSAFLWVSTLTGRAAVEECLCPGAYGNSEERTRLVGVPIPPTIEPPMPK